MAGKEVTRYEERFAQMAQEYASGENAGGEFLSVRGGILTFDGDPLPGNQMVVVILDAIGERTFYAEKYDATAEHNKPPVCYAFWRPGLEEAAPHIESMQHGKHYFEPQNDICATCPNNAWGSADTGRGKACGERRRFAVLPAGVYSAKKGSRDFTCDLFDDPEHYETADIAYLKIPVTSVKEYARYVTDLAATTRRPPVGVITRVYVEPHPKYQFQVKFETLELLPDELFDTIMERHEQAKAGIVFGYTAPSEEAEEKAAPRGKIRR